MNGLVKMITDGVISVEELAAAPELIERAKLVKEGLAACMKNITFPFGKNEIPCFSYMDRAGEYESWGSVNRDGTLVIWSNWGGNHEVGRVNIFQPAQVFTALENQSLKCNLECFLKQQIQKSSS